MNKINLSLLALPLFLVIGCLEMEEEDNEVDFEAIYDSVLVNNETGCRDARESCIAQECAVADSECELRCYTLPQCLAEEVGANPAPASEQGPQNEVAQELGRPLEFDNDQSSRIDEAQFPEGAEGEAAPRAYPGVWGNVYTQDALGRVLAAPNHNVKFCKAVGTSGSNGTGSCFTTTTNNVGFYSTSAIYGEGSYWIFVWRDDIYWGSSSQSAYSATVPIGPLTSRVDALSRPRPKPPTLLTPANGEVDVPMFPTFSWTDGLDAERRSTSWPVVYDLYTRTDSSSWSKLYSNLNQLSIGGAWGWFPEITVYWKVVAKMDTKVGAPGDKYYSTTSAVSSFTIEENDDFPPHANFTSQTTDVLTVKFTDTSTDDNQIVSWKWSFGDNQVSTTRNPTHAFASAGTYAVNLEVTDNAGQKNSVTKNVSVTAGLQPPKAPTQCGRILPGQGLAAGAKIKSCDGRFKLIMQTDGNLVLYKIGVSALWSSKTNGQPSFGAYMQGDGNLVIYTQTGTPLWATNTAGHNNAWLAVQNDGNVVVYSSSNTPLWATNTAGN